MGGLPDGWHLKTGEPVKDGDLVLRWQPGINDDMPTFKPNILANREVLENPRHHFT
jgi:hypothetical protein